MKTIAITNGVVATLGSQHRVLENHVVVIQEDKILDICDQSSFQKNYAHLPELEQIDAGGRVVMPGFINAHMHFYSSYARGLAKIKPSKNFVDVLNNLWWKLDKLLMLEDSYYSTLTASIEAIKHGTTTLIDHHASPFACRGSLDEVGRAVTDAGLRASLCYELSDRDGQKIADEGIEENIDFIKKCQNQGGDQLKALFGLHASFTIGDETLARAAEAGKALNAGFHVHCAEDAADQQVTHEKFDLRVVERFDRYGLLGPQTILAHGIHLSEREMNVVRDRQAIIVHNPQSNMNNAVGVAPLFKLLEKGILVGLGTDAMTTNMTEELRSALWLHKIMAKDPSVGFMECVGLLLKNNNLIAQRFWGSACGLGALAKGHKADVIITDYIPTTEIHDGNFAGHLVFGISQHPVRTTIANGRVLMRDFEIPHLNIADICRRSRELSSKVWNQFN